LAIQHASTKCIELSAPMPSRMQLRVISCSHLPMMAHAMAMAEERVHPVLWVWIVSYLQPQRYLKEKSEMEINTRKDDAYLSLRSHTYLSPSHILPLSITGFPTLPTCSLVNK
jgi:hypothetical protein